MIEDSCEARDIGRFIRARREKTLAHEFRDIPNRRRHVPHLTQSDLAELIDTSTVVVSQIEQGRYPNLNPAILQRLSRVLKLTPQQDSYLLELFKPRPITQKSSLDAPEWVTSSIQLIRHPIVVVDPALGLICLNKTAEWLFESMRPGFTPKSNAAESIFMIPAARKSFVEWEEYTASLVSGLRMTYAMYPEFRDHIDELASRLEVADPHFRTQWNLDDPLLKPTMEKKLIHPEAGELNVLQILTDIVEAPGLTRVELVPADETTRQKFEAV